MEREHLEVTDDVSIVEHLKHLVFITEGSYTNLKVRSLSICGAVMYIEFLFLYCGCPLNVDDMCASF